MPRPPDTLPRWVAAAAWLLKPDGVLTLIWRADGLAAVLEALRPAFGSVAVLPVYPRPDAQRRFACWCGAERAPMRRSSSLRASR